MTSLDQIKCQLLELGAPPDELERIIKDLGAVILLRVTRTFLSGLPEDQQRVIENLSPEDVIPYLKRHQFPMPNERELERIAEEVWDEYLAEMKK